MLSEQSKYTKFRPFCGAIGRRPQGVRKRVCKEWILYITSGIDIQLLLHQTITSAGYYCLPCFTYILTHIKEDPNLLKFCTVRISITEQGALQQHKMLVNVARFKVTAANTVSSGITYACGTRGLF